MRGFFDSHAHYDDPLFDGCREELLENIPADSVIITVGINAVRSRSSLSLAEKYPFIYAAVGIHPFETDGFEEQYNVIRALTEHRKCAALGEIGLDYRRDNKNEQKTAFIKQIELAAEKDLPVIVHTVNAWGDTMDILREYRPKGVIHSFSGSAEVCRECLSLGLYIGCSGGSLRSGKTRKALAEVPDDRLLIETDAPYQHPDRNSTELCSFRTLPQIALSIAEIRGSNPGHIDSITRTNGHKIFEKRMELL